MINGATVYGTSIFEEAIQEILNAGFQQDLNMNNHQIINLTTDENDGTSAANVDYVISYVSQPGSQGPLNLIQQNNNLTGDLRMDLDPSHYVKVKQPTDPAHATTKLYTDDQDTQTLQDAKNYTDQEISDLTTYIDDQDAATLQDANDYTDTQITATNARSLDQIATSNPTAASVDMNNQKIINVADPTNSGDVSTKNYTDTQDQSILSTANSNAQGYADTAQDNAESYTNDRFTQLRLNQITIDENLSMDYFTIDEIPVATLPDQVVALGQCQTIASSSANIAENNANQYTDDQIFGLQQQISDNDVELAGIQTELNGIDSSISSLQTDVADQRDKIRSPDDVVYAQASNTSLLLQADGQNIRAKTLDFGISSDLALVPAQLNAIGFNVHQQSQAGIDTIGIISVQNNGGSSVDFGAISYQNGLISLPNGQNVDTASFLQCLFLNQNVNKNTAFVLSSGQALVDNSILLSNEPTVLIPTMFNKKAGYQSGITISEDNQFATKKYVDDNMGGGGIQNPLTENIDGDSTYKFINCIDPTSAQDVATKNYIDTALLDYYPDTTRLDQIVAPTASLSLNSQKITNLLTGTTDTDAVTKLQMDTADNLRYLATTTLNNITAPNGDLSLNSNKITNLTPGVAGTDAATVSQITGGITPNAVYTTTLSPSANGQVFTITHSLGLQFSSLDIRVQYQFTAAVNGFSIGDILDQDFSCTDVSNNGKTFGLGYVSIGASTTQFTLILGSSGVGILRKTGGTSDNTTITNFTQVNVLVYVTQKASPQILQANSLNTSQLIVNSGLDFATGNYTVQAADPINATDLTTKQWIQANVAVGTPQLIQNTGVPTSSLTAQATQLLNGSFPLNLNSQKIIGLSNATLNTDAINLQQLNAYTPTQILNGTTRVIAGSTTISIGSTTLNTAQFVKDGSLISFQTDSFTIDSNNSGAQIAKFDGSGTGTTHQLRLNKKLKLSTNSTNTQAYGYYQDISTNTLTNQPLFYLDGTGITGGQPTMFVQGDIQSGNGGTPTRMSQNGIQAQQGEFYQTTDALIVKDASATVLPAATTQLITCYTPTGGVYALQCFQNYISAGFFETYVPVSENIRKHMIRPANMEGLDQVSFMNYYFNPNAFNDISEQFRPVFNREQFGIILDRQQDGSFTGCPNRYQLSREDPLTGTICRTVNLSLLKDDILSYAHEKAKRVDQLEQLVQQQQNQLISLSSRFEQLLQNLNISV